MRTKELAVGVLTVAAVSACTSTDAADPAASSEAPATSTITVFAAASLQETFEELGARFSEQNPGTSVQFSFGGSSGLLTQLTQGAPADVFATADTPTMDRAREAQLVTESAAFATNVLTIATAPGNPLDVRTLADLSRPDLSVVVCAQPVPCGAATARVTEDAGVTLTPVSEEESVSGVLAKVRSGQADAGLVYRTDVQASDGAVEGIDFPESEDAVNVYPIAQLNESANPAAAQQFIDFVVSPQGRAELAEAGFGAP